MSKLNKPIRRTTSAEFKGRKLMIELHPLFVRIREYGRRLNYDVPWDAVYALGARLKAIQDGNQVPRAR